ncbi:MAG: alpha/beta hydrolase [Actinocatenispora sp.]
MTSTLFLVHGGFFTADMDAERFWRRTGIVARLQDRGLTVHTPDRLPEPPDWAAEAAHLEPSLPTGPVTVLAGSNGCSAAVRLALGHPDRVGRLVLAWPATAGDRERDDQIRRDLTGQGVPPQVADALLAGGTLRGVTDAEIASLRMPVAVVPSVPDNPVHRRRTVDALLRLLPEARELPGCPEPPVPSFPPHADAFVDAVTGFVTT